MGIHCEQLSGIGAQATGRGLKGAFPAGKTLEDIRQEAVQLNLQPVSRFPSSGSGAELVASTLHILAWLQYHQISALMLLPLFMRPGPSVLALTWDVYRGMDPSTCSSSANMQVLLLNITETLSCVVDAMLILMIPQVVRPWAGPSRSMEQGKTGGTYHPEFWVWTRLCHVAILWLQKGANGLVSVNSKLLQARHK